VPSYSDTGSVELGVRFSTSTAGSVTAVRFWKGVSDTGQHVGNLWSSGGKRLATVTFTSESAQGWQQASFAQPVTLSAGATYTISYFAPVGGYGVTRGFFANKLSSGPLTATAGTFAYSSSSTFPMSTYKANNYFVDLVFVPTATAPTVTPPATPPTATPPATPPTATPPATPPTATPPATTPTAPAPTTASAGVPNSSNTGVPSGTVLQASGALTVTTAGAVIDALDISGGVVIEAPNVVIKRSRITGSGDYGVQVLSGDVTIEDSEISGFSNAIAFDNWKAYRVNIHGVTDDGVKLGSNVLLQDSYLHDFTPSAGAHADGGQMQSGEVNLVVRHNYINPGLGTNSALFIAPDLGPSSPGPVTIDGNILGGGNFTIYCVDGNNGQYFVRNISITNNRFLNNAQYGPDDVNVPVTWAGNVWDATGASLGL